MEDTWRTDVDTASLNPNVKTGMLERLLFGYPYAVYVERTPQELGQDAGESRYERPQVLATTQDRVDGMRRVKTPTQEWQSGEPGINYIVGPSELEFGSASMLKLSIEFKIQPTKTENKYLAGALRCGWVAGPAQATFSMMRRTVFEISTGTDQLMELGGFNMAVLSTSGTTASSAVLWDEAPPESNAFRMEEWRECDVWAGDIVMEEDDVISIQEARQRVAEWMRPDASRFCIIKPEGDTETVTAIWYKAGEIGHPCGRHPFFRKAKPNDKRHVLCHAVVAQPVTVPILDPAAAPQVTTEIVVAMDLYLYEFRRFAWVGVSVGLAPGPTLRELGVFRKRLELKESLDKDDEVPAGTVGVVVDPPVHCSELPTVDVMVSPLRVVRVMEDFVELWTSRCWPKVYGSFLVIAFWVSTIAVNPAVVEAFIQGGQAEKAAGVKYCFLCFVVATAVLVWLEVRLAFCCEKGRKLRYLKPLAFCVALALSSLEKYDIYGDLNFIRVARHKQPDGWIWKAGLAIFVWGVGLMQILPSLLLLLSCLSCRVARLGIPKDFVLLCRFSGLHMLMESINHAHVAAAAEPAFKGAAVREEQRADTEEQAPLLAGAAVPRASSPPEAVADASTSVDIKPTDDSDASKYFDVPLPPETDVEELRKRKNLAKVKKIVGAVRFLCEDMLQGVLQLFFVAANWDDLTLVQRAQVIGSVGVGLTVSAMGPFMESQKFAKSSTELIQHDKWVVAGGPISKHAEEIIAKEKKKRDGATFDGIGELVFDRPMRLLGTGGAEPSILRNGTVARPNQVVTGCVTCGPQSKFATAITQYILGFTNVDGEASNMVPLYNGCPGHHPKVETVKFSATAPPRPGIYPVGFHFDMQYTMEDAKRGFKTVSEDNVIGYVVVAD